MDSPKISTYREIVPLVYSWTTPDIPKYEGWEKIGYTTQDVDRRIAQQASQLNIRKKKEWARRAFFTSEEGGTFTDKDFHRYLRKQGVERERGSEWHRFDDAPRRSIEYFSDFQGQDFTTAPEVGQEDYVLRPEQQAAVRQAVTAFEEGYSEVLWNAKPRFGKTLTTYDLMRVLDAKKVLIVTNRPAIANSWFDDFAKFIGHQTTYQFVSESPSLAERNPMTREQYRKFHLANKDNDPRRIEFVSLQDLKGSTYFGGMYDKNKYISDLHWDLLVIDEAHEGVDTTKTSIAFDQMKRAKTLHLSGTPFRTLASGKFSEDQIYNWTYEDEQEAKRNWDDPNADNPYESLPTLNLLTYQMSRIISDQLEVGVAASDDEDAENIDYAFNLNEFFATKDNGFFEHEADVEKFLDRLTVNEKYPFSTPQLRDEIRHSFWLLDRVASARTLKKLLNKHPVFQDYEVVLAAGDGRANEDDPSSIGRSLDMVRAAIAEAEETGGKTITLSVGQLTTGVTVPEWTAVMMLSNIKSPAQYMQAAFRSQNPCIFERNSQIFEKQNAYIFDFAPERTLTIFDAFSNNLNPNPSGDPEKRRENIRTLLNFFPVIGEDSEGRMVELDAEQVLTFPQMFRAREVVRRGFMSNLLFDNVAGIFRYSQHFKEILDKLPVAKEGKIRADQPIEMPEPPPTVNEDGTVIVDQEIVINPKVEALGKPVWKREDLPPLPVGTPRRTAAREIAKVVTEKGRVVREELREQYGLTKAQTTRDERRTARQVEAQVERALTEHDISRKRLDDEIKEAATEAQAAEIELKVAELDEEFEASILDIAKNATDSIPLEIVTREETKTEQKRADDTMDEARAHLRGFARTIPMFLMAYGDRNTRLSNFDDYTPDDVFTEITGITEEEFRQLRDGQTLVGEDGEITKIPGLFDATVFDQAIQEFLNKKEELADYFDDDQVESIFAYIPQQKTSLVFTPQSVVEMMVDALEAENPGIFNDPTKTFADLFSTAGLFLMELVRRLDKGLENVILDPIERLKHVLTSQIFEMSHNAILHRITLEAVSGGIQERKDWMEQSGHFKVGNIATMTEKELHAVVDDMFTKGN